MDDVIKVLVVDDDPDILLGTSRIVESEGFEVYQADSGGEALHQARVHHPDLILLDVVLPDQDGFSICEQIKKDADLQDAFVLLVSGKKIAPDDQASGLSIGADGYITRPFVKNEFIARLNSLLRIQQTQKQIKQSEQWLQTTLKSIGDGVIATDASGAVIFMNPMAEKITGWRFDDATGRSCNEIFRIRNDETGEIIPDPIKKVLNEGIILGLTNHTILFRPDGTTCYIADSAAPIKDQSGNITGAVLVFQDVTADREKELAINLAHREWEDIFQAIGHPTILLDADQKIIRANRSVLDLLQQPIDSIIGRNCYQIFHKAESPPHCCPFTNIETSGSIEKQDMEMEALGRIFLVSCTPVYNQSNQLKHVIHIATDITKRKQAEIQVQKDLEERNAMLKEIHHRVKNNLQVIISILELQLRHTTSPKTKDVLQEIESRIFSMAVVHEKLYHTENFAAIHMKEYICLIVEQLIQIYAGENKISTVLEVDDLLLNIEKAVPCGLIMTEWMSNALKHGFPKGQEGRIYIRFSQNKAGQKKLVFGDTGIGIPDEIDIYNPDTMGLTIVSSLIDQMRGTLVIQKAKGTEYSLIFE